MNASNPWLWLLIAGTCEVIYALIMPHSKSFTRIVPSAFTILFIALSMYCLSLAMRSLPVGTAYAVWVGIGACGTAIAGIFFLQESRDPMRLIGLGLIVCGIVLLKITHK